MSITQQKIFKNTSILMVSQIISWGLSLVLTLYLPRYLGVENIGKYQLATSLWSIVAILATFGMDTYLTREIAQDHKRVDELLSQSIVMKIFLFVVGSGLLAIYVSFSHYNPDTIQVIMIIAVANLISLISTGFAATVQGLERVEYLGLTNVISGLVSTTTQLIAIFFHANLFVIAWVASIGAACTFISLFLALHHVNNFRFHFTFNNLRRFAFASSSFFLLHIFINLYQQVDIIVISWILSEKGVGWYGVATRLTGSLMFIPSVFMTVFFPTFSRLSSESPDELRKLFRKAVNYMVLLGVGVGTGMFIISAPLINLLYGAEFERSGPILAVRGLVSVFTFVNIILGIYLIAINRQKSWIMVMAGATLLTIPLDLVLVPLSQQIFNNGALGGAFSYLITELGTVIIGICLLPKKTLYRDEIWYFFRSLLAGAGMVLGTWWLRDVFIAVPILVGSVIFLTLSILLKLVSKDEWIILTGILTSIVKKLNKRYRTAE